MTHTEVRSARPEDKNSVLAFCVHTWDWGDYIDRVWDEWLVDPQGELFVAVTDGHPTGVGHLRMLNETDAWFEGLRVDPNYRQQGIAKALDMAMLEVALRRGATNARLVTESTNTGAIHMMDSIHMRRVGAFAPFRADPLVTQAKSRTKVDYNPEGTALATVDDLDEIIDYLNVSNVFPAVGGLYYAGFIGYEITAALLEKQVTAQNVYLLRRWNRLDGLAIAEEREDRQGKRLSIGYIDGMTIEAISLIAYDLRQRLVQKGLDSAYVYAPDLMLIRDGLTGIEYEWDGKIFYTYERSLE
jgi:ribosomal protein S18 acetylase RimI-like enzyme